ncbi:glycerophosphoinositol inositolphosphodiesterase GDPD2 isoform X1 [Takifugu rubripes]|uniref:Glycerophosphodiester phosphodiesterase domain containing 2 n=1 Tax=Takifugu rubripes TaxID=31033 RepID=H2TH64_TAKRU|nr:glycerophosphoinositol inositolphosphodiesterase GDPD2 isoform X1 [Takifugu rubripes]|eukprot:XP_011608756.1 PREDICTED: glycerophosphoinositol inositolphosphodiesterase GDPD2 isoform X1 [Takifugu rubripes]
MRSAACIQAAQMQEEDNCCRVFFRGVYSCHWKLSSNSEGRCAGCWFILVVLVSLVSLCWMYICLVTFNDQDEVNWQGFTQLSLWVNWFMLLVIISAVLTSYCLLLLLFALFQVALREPLDLHWLHKVLLGFGVLFIFFGVTGISIKWRKEWPTVPLSLRATAPFLQFGAVGALTLLSPFVFKGFHAAKAKWSRFFIVAVPLAVSAGIFLCPLYIQTQCPCLTEQLPKKPDLIGHRGAPMLAPENTMMSFSRSIGCGVTAFETDVQLSKDRVPFLMHDHQPGFLLRTTDVKERFPDNITSNSSEFTWEELQTLNAGDWFLKTDPFRSVSKLSEEDKAMARNQTIPSLLQLLRLAKQHNISVMFDLYSPDWENDTEDVVDTILESGIDPHLVLWLPPAKREYVKKAAPEFKQVYKDSERLRNKSGNLNVKYSYDIEEIRKLRKMNVSVNVWVVNERWLFSLMWCLGVSSVTTNSCHLLKDMRHPDWVMSPQTYTIIWIIVDIASVGMMAVLYIIYRKNISFCHRKGTATQQNALSAMDDKEQHPFLEKN